MRLGEHMRTDSGWEIVDISPTDDRAISLGTNFLVGNGALGYRGTRPDQRADAFVACVVAGTYDMADGKLRELCTVPNGLYARLLLDGEPLTLDPLSPGEMELTLRNGEVRQRATWSTPSGSTAGVHVRRTASLVDLGALAQVITITPERDGVLEIVAGIDTVVWSMNGDHFRETSSAPGDPISTRTCVTGERGIEIVVASGSQVTVTGAVGTTSTPSTPPSGGSGDSDSADDSGDGELVARCWRVEVSAGDIVTVLGAMGVATDVDGPDAPGRATATAARVLDAGYEATLRRSSDGWRRFWDTADVVIDGDLEAQAALRFSTYHNRIATPAHTDRLPIGARGLSCQAYQGAAFWDQEMFNLPAYLVTAPHVVRNLLVYRWRTLDGARRKAERLGYRGAYYAWMSGDDGREECPDFFFVDVLSGRPIRNHFNDWQMHISPDVALAAWRYVRTTDDVDFLADHGAEILFEVARFLHSFVRFDEVRERYEVIRLLGPDEWHENVDNDAYTNHVSRLALGHALAAHELLATRRPKALTRLQRDLDIGDDDLAAWHRVRDHLRVMTPDPDTLLVEQFDGFHELEDCRPADLRARLLDPTEYWGWPNGVAVHTQVSKQPAVVQLLAVDPTAFPLEVQRRNYDHYVPRCAAGSTLSHSVHAAVASRLAALDPRYLDDAYEAFMATATIDLRDRAHSLVGGTFIGGIHTAANAGAYQNAVFGFGGLDVDHDHVAVDPHLPPAWQGLTFTVLYRGQRLTVRAEPGSTTVSAASANTSDVPVRIGDADRPVRPLAPGATARS